MTDTSALITRLEVIAKRYALDEVKEAAARIAELKAALKPFAHKAQFYLFDSDADDAVVEVDLIAGDLRAARAAYLGEKE